jgi:hypothetical protein
VVKLDQVADDSAEMYDAANEVSALPLIEPVAFDRVFKCARVRTVSGFQMVSVPGHAVQRLAIAAWQQLSTVEKAQRSVEHVAHDAVVFPAWRSHTVEQIRHEP